MLWLLFACFLSMSIDGIDCGFFLSESALIPFVSFGDLNNNTFKGLTSLPSVEQEIQYDEHTRIVYNDQ
jgi:hypothetical protein